MFSFEDIYGWDASHYGKDCAQESVYQYFPLFHHSADEYSPELFSPKEQLEDSLPTDARLEPDQHPLPQATDAGSLSVEGSASGWSEGRSAESILYPAQAL